MGSDLEKANTKKKPGKKGSQQSKDAFEIEDKPKKPPKGVRNDGNKYKNDFKTPLLDDSNHD